MKKSESKLEERGPRDDGSSEILHGSSDEKGLFERNMDALSRVLGPMLPSIPDSSTLHSKLVFDDDGEPDIEFRGAGFYGRGAFTHAREQVDGFMESPDRVSFAPPGTGNMDDVGAKYVFDTLRRAVDNDVQFAPTSVSDECHFLIVYGVGLGAHIEHLVERTNCKSLILVEPNLEFLSHSLSVVDWHSWLERFEGDDDRFLYLCVDNDPEKIFFSVAAFIRSHGAAFFDGTIFFSHYHNSAMELADNKIKEDARVIVTGLGFLEDEMLMIENSFKNLINYESPVFKILKNKSNLPAFIVASGPSVDDGLDVIKENANKAIIISCGTALGVLLANDIVPDFHVEMENVDTVFDILDKKSKHFDLDGVCLVASTTIDHRVSATFQRKALFFRRSLSSWDVFSLGEEYGLHEVGPTVANTGLSFALGVTMGDIYLFGVDLGTTRKEVHHSKDSDYYADGVVTYVEDPFNIEARGNFGGRVFTHSTFVWARTAAETAIRSYRRGRVFYNCSKGLAIEGTTPRLPAKVKIQDRKDKTREIEKIFGGFEQYSRETFDGSWGKRDWASAVEDLCGEIRECCDLEDEEFLLRYLARANRILAPLGVPATAELMLCRGSIMMCFITASYYLARVNAAEKIPVMENILRDEMRQMIDRVEEEATVFLRGMEKLRTEQTETPET